MPGYPPLYHSTSDEESYPSSSSADHDDAASSSSHASGSTSTNITDDPIFLDTSPKHPNRALPYPTTATYRLSPSLRPRRRGLRALIQLAKKRIGHLVLALGVALLALLVLRERSLSSSLRSEVTRLSRQTERGRSSISGVNVAELRSEYEKKRRREAGGVAGWLRRMFGSQKTLNEEEKLAQEGLPSWWGNADVVGPSPLDYLPEPFIGAKRRVLFLTGTHGSLLLKSKHGLRWTGYFDYLERMNTHTYEIVDGMLHSCSRDGPD